MKFIVDANIVFSGILNTNSKIGDLLINSSVYFDFLAPDFLRSEIRKHYPRLIKISGMTNDEVQEAEFQIYKDIVFITEEQIKISHWIAKLESTHISPNFNPNPTNKILVHFSVVCWQTGAVPLLYKNHTMTAYLKFKELHNQAKPLIIGNVWNVQSAKVFEKLGFQAIATSSAAIAHSLGYEDGEQMPFSDLLFIVERIRKSITLPLSVDIEFGYGKTATEIANNIIALHTMGVVGINIEDSSIENGERKLKDASQFSQLLQDVKRILMQNKVSIFMNVRCDAFLLSMPNPLQVATERVGKYVQVADGIFLPGITQESDIVEIVSLVDLPINVMCMPQLPDFKTLNKIGVRRISMGNFLNGFTYTSLENITTKILAEQSFIALF